MNFVSRTITGIVLIIVGLVLIILSPKMHFVSLIYGIPFFIIGFFILFNKSEDKIERRKDFR
jgi:membrane-bound ClpP family serine protease